MAVISLLSGVSRAMEGRLVPGAERGLRGIPAGGAVDSKAGQTGCADSPSAIRAPGQSSWAVKGEAQCIK